MLSVVLVPMILAGFLISTRVRRAARAKSASAEMPRPGSDGAAEELALCGDDVEGGGGAHVDDDGGAAEQIEGGDAVDDAVGADFAGVVGEDGKAGLDAGLDEERADVEEGFADAAEGGVERRDDGGDGDAGDDVGREAAHGEEGLEAATPSSSAVCL